MFEVSLESEFINNLSQESRSWLAKAIGVVILGDGQVDNEELIWLKAAISFLEDESEIVELVTAVKSRSKLELGRIDERMDRAATIYFYLATVITINGRVTREEADLFKSIAGKLGLPPEYARSVLQWASDVMKLNKQRNQLIKAAKELRPQYYWWLLKRNLKKGGIWEDNFKCGIAFPQTSYRSGRFRFSWHMKLSTFF